MSVMLCPLIAMIWDVPVVQNASCTLLGMPAASRRVIAEQNAGEERGLWFGEDLRYDAFCARLERTPRKRGEPSKQSQALITCQRRHAWT